MNPTQYLFIYGTLMRASSSEMGRLQRKRLMTESTFVGTAQTLGQLYDLGSYPAIKVDDTATKPNRAHAQSQRRNDANRVKGEVVKLINQQRSFPWLDAFEGIIPDDIAGDGQYQRTKYQRTQYRRTTREVTLDTGRALVAALYVFQGPIQRGRRIADGQWRR